MVPACGSTLCLQCAVHVLRLIVVAKQANPLDRRLVPAGGTDCSGPSSMPHWHTIEKTTESDTKHEDNIKILYNVTNLYSHKCCGLHC